MFDSGPEATSVSLNTTAEVDREADDVDPYHTLRRRRGQRNRAEASSATYV